MIKIVACLFAVAALVWSCGQVESGNNDSVAGVYVREYSREILNQLSGDKVGTRSVRDTLFIELNGDHYKVKNTKWSMNDYDNDGWQNMQHSESKPLPSFEAIYDKESKALVAKQSGTVPNVVLSEDGKLSVGTKSEIAYTKID